MAIPGRRARAAGGLAVAGLPDERAMTGSVPAPGAVLITVLALGGLAFSLLQSMVAPALPPISHDLHASLGSAGWIVTSYLLAAAVATPIAGRMGDEWGRRRVLVAVLALLAAGCVIAALAGSLAVLVAGRVLQGVAGAVFPLAFGILRDGLPARRVSTAVGLLSAMVGIGGGIGIVLAGPIVSGLNWHWIFWVPLMVTIIALAATVALVPESVRPDAGRVSVRGALLLTGWLVSLLLAVSNASAWGWTSPLTVGLFSAAAVLAAAWARAEARSRQPLVDLHLLLRRPVWAADLSALAFGFGLYGSFLLVPGLLEAPAFTGYGFGLSVTAAGLFLLPGSVMMLLFGPVSGVMTRRLGPRAPIVAGGAVSCAAFALPAIAHTHMWQILACATGSGTGIGLAYAALPNAIIAHVPSAQTGAATGVNTLARSIGSSIGAAVVAAILAARIVPGGFPWNNGFTIGFAACAAMFGIGGGAALLIPGGREARLGPALRPS
jgi:EmrB/QacA subfamily drug resistance transporter